MLSKAFFSRSLKVEIMSKELKVQENYFAKTADKLIRLHRNSMIVNHHHYCDLWDSMTQRQNSYETANKKSRKCLQHKWLMFIYILSSDSHCLVWDNTGLYINDRRGRTVILNPSDLFQTLCCLYSLESSWRDNSNKYAQLWMWFKFLEICILKLCNLLLLGAQRQIQILTQLLLNFLPHHKNVNLPKLKAFNTAGAIQELKVFNPFPNYKF